jgi:hypothetical protein
MHCPWYMPGDINKNNTPWDRQNERMTDRITIPRRKYILTCPVQDEKNDSPIELGV